MGELRNWRPLQKIAHDDFDGERPEVIAKTIKHYGISAAEAVERLQAEFKKCEYYVNDLYQVQVQPCPEQEGMLHINIRRRDGSITLRDWRHFQQIKNEIAGPEREAFEIYPAESRKVDTSNKFHLWVLPENCSMDIGWKYRDVQYAEHKNVPGMRQRGLK